LTLKQNPSFDPDLIIIDLLSLFWRKLKEKPNHIKL